MKILVDADACPVKEIILGVAKKYMLELIMLFDTSHEYFDGYSKVVICDKGNDSVDYKLLSLANKGDLIITQDYGLSALGLSKKAYILHINGFIIDEKNIDSLLNNRYLGVKSRRTNKHIKGPKKRTNDDDLRFKDALITIINKIGEIKNE